jgi:hypothetical protein
MRNKLNFWLFSITGALALVLAGMSIAGMPATGSTLGAAPVEAVGEASSVVTSTLRCLQIAARAEDCEEYQEILDSNDLLSVTAARVRDPNSGEFFFSEKAYEEAKSNLMEVQNVPARKGIIFSSYEDMEDKIDDIKSYVDLVGYNSEPEMTPAEELDQPEDFVTMFAQLVRSRGLAVGWGPSNEILSPQPELLELASELNRITLQHQNVLTEDGVEATVSLTKQRSLEIRESNPNVEINLVLRGEPQEIEDVLLQTVDYIDSVLILTAPGDLFDYQQLFNDLDLRSGCPDFYDVSDDAGVGYQGRTYGLGWGDFDGSGYLDLVGTLMLYHNNGDGTFTDVLEGSGIRTGSDQKDSGWADYDNDGDLDLYITHGAKSGLGEGPNELYQNDGLGHFVNVAEEVGVTDDLGRGRGAAWADYDNDGDLDLFVANATRADAPDAFFRNNGDGTFTNIAAEVGLADAGSSYGVAWADYDNDGDPDLYVAGDQSRLYRNDGSAFTDVTSSAGVGAGLGQAPTWGDYDNDGDLDLFVSSGFGKGLKDYQTLDDNVIMFVGGMDVDREDGLDFVTPAGADVTFHLQEWVGAVENQDPTIIFLGPDGHHPAENPFTLTSDTRERPDYEPGVDEGLFVWSEPGVWHIRWTAPDLLIDGIFSGLITATTPISDVTEVSFDQLTAPSSYPDHLFQNEGDGTFTDVAATAGVTCELDTRGAAWGDYDNDGDLDLFLVVTGDVSGNGADRLYWNNGHGIFTDVAVSEGVTGTDGGRGWAAMWADYDNDGFLDMYVHHRGIVWPIPPGSRQLFHNRSNNNHWLKLQLIGDVSNRDSLGTKVWVTAGGRTQFRELKDESTHFAHYSGPLHVGLGANTVADEVRIEWPSRSAQVLANVQADQLLTLYEGQPPQLGTLFVATNGKDTNNCSSLASACRTVQRAVDLAAEGNTIKVATGVYTDDDTSNVGYTVALTKTVTLRGGYDATFTDPPDPVAKPTTLDAQRQGRVISITGEISPTIEGFIITGGNASGLGGASILGVPGDGGGGIYINNASPIILNNIVNDNIASTLTNTPGLGGGIELESGSASTIISGNQVFSNTASTGFEGRGGGLHIRKSVAIVSNNTVYSNIGSTARFGGSGGLHVSQSEATITDNLLQGNIGSTAADGTGGGAIVFFSENAVFSGNTVLSNIASTAGYGKGGGLVFKRNTNLLVSDNHVQDNICSMTTWGTGGGIFLKYTVGAEISGNSVLFNMTGTSLDSKDRGGGLYLESSDGITLTNNVFADNQANATGSGLYVESCSPCCLLHTTIARNTGGDGSGIYVTNESLDYSSVALTNTILVSQTVGISITAGTTVTLEATLWGTGTWANDTDWGGPGSITTGTINVWGDPAFVDPESGNYHIGPDSAAIDSGVETGVTIDIDGEPRVVGTGYDIGADEYLPKECASHCLYLPVVWKQYAP